MSTDHSGDKHMQLSLADAEALVLFDLLGRLIDDEKGGRLRELVDHDAEIWALNSVYLGLQRTLVQPFKSDYRQLVEAARAEVAGTYGGDWPI